MNFDNTYDCPEYRAWVAAVNADVDLEKRLQADQQILRDYNRASGNPGVARNLETEEKAKGAGNRILDAHRKLEKIQALRTAFERTKQGALFVIDEAIAALVTSMEGSWRSVNINGTKGVMPPHWRTNEQKLQRMREQRAKMLGLLVPQEPELTTYSGSPTRMPNLRDDPFAKHKDEAEDRAMGIKTRGSR